MNYGANSNLAGGAGSGPLSNASGKQVDTGSSTKRKTALHPESTFNLVDRPTFLVKLTKPLMRKWTTLAEAGKCLGHLHSVERPNSDPELTIEASDSELSGFKIFNLNKTGVRTLAKVKCHGKKQDGSPCDKAATHNYQNYIKPHFCSDCKDSRMIDLQESTKDTVMEKCVRIFSVTKDRKNRKIQHVTMEGRPKVFCYSAKPANMGSKDYGDRMRKRTVKAQEKNR